MYASGTYASGTHACRATGANSVQPKRTTESRSRRAAIVGLSLRAKWGWGLSAALGLLYAPSACLPFGIVLLVVLLRKDVRSAFRLL